jgi:hypothetical protein
MRDRQVKPEVVLDVLFAARRLVHRVEFVADRQKILESPPERHLADGFELDQLAGRQQVKHVMVILLEDAINRVSQIGARGFERLRADDGPRPGPHIDEACGLHLQERVANDVRPSAEARGQLADRWEPVAGRETVILDQAGQPLDDVGEKRSALSGSRFREFHTINPLRSMNQDGRFGPRPISGP